MFVNGFLRLIEAGIIRREVFADATLQRCSTAAASPTRPSRPARCRRCWTPAASAAR
jgi:hypothetical protein